MKKIYLLLIMNMVCGVLNGMENEVVQKVDSSYLRAKRESILLKGLQYWLGQGVEQSSDRALDYLGEVLEGGSEDAFQLFISVISEHELETKHGLIPLDILAKLTKRFLENDIDREAKDTLGKLALHFASKSGHRDLWSQEALDLIWINRAIFPEDVVNFVLQEMMKDPGLRSWLFQNISIPVRTLEGHSFGVNSAVYSPYGKHVVAVSFDKTAKIWDSGTGELIHTLKGHTNSIRSVVYSPDGKNIVTASWDNTAKIWDSETGELVRILKGHTGWVNSAIFSPDGKSIVTASKDGTAKIWDSETGKMVRALEGHTDCVNSANYSSDGKSIVTTSIDTTAKIWDSETGALLHTLEGHKHYVYSAVYSPDGNHIVTGSWDRTAKIWDTKTGKSLRTLEGHTGLVKSVVYSPDGKSIVTGSCDKTAKIWDSETGELVRTLEGHTGWVNSAAYSPDGKHVVTASYDQTEKIWDISLIDFIENELSPKHASLILSLYKEQDDIELKTVLDRWQKDLQNRKTEEEKIQQDR